MMHELSNATWRKASASLKQWRLRGVADNLSGVIAIRDSKQPGLGAHVVSRSAFAAFVADAKSGAYDLAPEVS